MQVIPRPSWRTKRHDFSSRSEAQRHAVNKLLADLKRDPRAFHQISRDDQYHVIEFVQVNRSSDEANKLRQFLSPRRRSS